MISGLRYNSFHGEHFLVPEHSLRFSTKQRVWVLNPDIREHLWPYMCPIIPYPTGRFFRGTLSQALRARGTSCQGTSCQATIGVVPTGRACRHFATASS